MTQNKKAAERMAAIGEWLRTGFFIAGLLMLALGIFIEFGIGYALIAAGAACIFTVLLPLVIRNAA